MASPDTITTGDGRTIQLSMLREMSDRIIDRRLAFDRETCLALIASVRRQAEEIASLREWKSSILSALKTVPEFETGEWAGDKEGWGFCFEFIHWMRREIASLRERVARHGTTSIRPVFPVQPEDMP